MNEALDKMLKQIPLKTRLKVSTEMAFINLITELGYRENKMWTEDEDEILNKLCSLAVSLSEDHIKEMEEWINESKISYNDKK